jgi:hypothetical protein
VVAGYNSGNSTLSGEDPNPGFRESISEVTVRCTCSSSVGALRVVQLRHTRFRPQLQTCLPLPRPVPKPRLLNPDLPVYCVFAMCTQSSHKVGSGIKRVLQGAADVTLNVVDRAGG